MSQNEMLAAMFAAQKGPVSAERMRAAMDAYFETWRRNDIDARLKLFVDEDYVGVGAPGVALSWTPARSGRYVVRAVDDSGRADSRLLQVAFVR